MFQKGTPGRDEGEPRPEHFRYTSTPPGTKPWTAWCACEPYWCRAHVYKDSPTKPCLKWITSGELTCHLCKPLHILPLVGYLGVWREADLTARLIVLREENSELSEGLQFGDYVIISREDGEGNPVGIRKTLQQKIWKSRKVQRQRPADLYHSLVTIWDIPILTEWYASKKAASDNAMSTKRTVCVKDDGSLYGVMEQAAARKNGALTTSDPTTLAQYDKLLAQFKRRGEAIEPSTNGQHKKGSE